MSGRPWLAAAERQALARAVRTARRNRMPWKVIEHLYGRSRVQLHRYLRNETKEPRNETSARLSGHARA